MFTAFDPLMPPENQVMDPNKVFHDGEKISLQRVDVLSTKDEARRAYLRALKPTKPNMNQKEQKAVTPVGEIIVTAKYLRSRGYELKQEGAKYHYTAIYTESVAAILREENEDKDIKNEKAAFELSSAKMFNDNVGSKKFY